MGSVRCSRTKAQLKADRPNQPIPTQTNGVCTAQSLCEGFTGLKGAVQHLILPAGVVQTVVAAATSALRLGQLG